MSAPIRIALVGLGKIVRDQHLPAILADPRFALTATVSPTELGVRGIAHFDSLDALLAGLHPLDAVALCTPRQVRYTLAQTALTHGLDVLLEKPPVATVEEVYALRQQAEGAALQRSTIAPMAAADCANVRQTSLNINHIRCLSRCARTDATLGDVREVSRESPRPHPFASRSIALANGLSLSQ